MQGRKDATLRSATKATFSSVSERDRGGCLSGRDGCAILHGHWEQARVHGLPEVRLYTNEAMTENVYDYQRHGYRETRRATDNGFRRVFFTKVVT